MLKSRHNLLAVLALAAFAPLAATPSHAQNAKQLLSGSTAVTLNDTLVAGLTEQGVTITGNAPAALVTSDGTTVATFPVVSGGVDLDTLTGVVYHSGGLTFTSTVGSSVVVTVSQLALVNSIPGQPAQMYGLVVVGGKVYGLYPLFNLTTPLNLPLTGNSVSLPNINLTLSPQAATLLNDAFGFNGFSSGQEIGSAALNAPATSYIVQKKPVQ
jgi:hypothetical protein